MKISRKKSLRTFGRLTKLGRQNLELSMTKVAKTLGVKTPEKRELQISKLDILQFFSP